MRWGKSDSQTPRATETDTPAPVPTAVRIATLLAEGSRQTTAAAGTGAATAAAGDAGTGRATVGAGTASRAWTLTENLATPATSAAEVVTTYRVSAAVADDDAAGPDPALSYDLLVRYRESLSAAGFVVTDVLEGWRTIALDVLTEQDAAIAHKESNGVSAAPVDADRSASEAVLTVTAAAPDVTAPTAAESEAVLEAVTAEVPVATGSAGPAVTEPAATVEPGPGDAALVDTAAASPVPEPDRAAESTGSGEVAPAEAETDDAAAPATATPAEIIAPAEITASGAEGITVTQGADVDVDVAGDAPEQTGADHEASDQAALAATPAGGDETDADATDAGDGSARKSRKRRGDGELGRPRARRGLLGRRRPADA
ncbi:hypothetical protein ND747_20480, partial [Frankia sp. R82]|nr:hypothetical protein [Frankia sp. R82]